MEWAAQCHTEWQITVLKIGTIAAAKQMLKNKEENVQIDKVYGKKKNKKLLPRLTSGFWSVLIFRIPDKR